MVCACVCGCVCFVILNCDSPLDIFAVLGSQKIVDRISDASALVDRPNDKTLSPPAVTRCEDALDVRSIVAMEGVDIVPLVDVQAEVLHYVVFRGNESHRKDGELARPFLLGPGDRVDLAIRIDGNLLGDDVSQVVPVVTNKLLRNDRVLTRVLAEDSLDLTRSRGRNRELKDQGVVEQGKSE